MVAFFSDIIFMFQKELGEKILENIQPKTMVEYQYNKL